jgi:signal transduction histidine kinase
MGRRKQDRRFLRLVGVSFLICSIACPGALAAADPDPRLTDVIFAGEPGIIAVEAALILGLVLFVVVAAAAHLDGRRRWGRREAALRTDLAGAREKLARAELFLSAEPSLVLAWNGTGEIPEIDGDPGLVSGKSDPLDVLDFAAWLPVDVAQRLKDNIATLRRRGEAFRLTVTTRSGRPLDLMGRPMNGAAVVRIRDVSEDRLEAIRLDKLNEQAVGELKTFRSMLDAVAHPAWARDANGRLTWANAAYAHAVEAKDGADAVARGAELLERAERDASAASRAEGAIWRARAPLVVAGERKIFDIVDVPGPSACAGMAMDGSVIESMRAALKREVEAHARTLDQLSTAVAIFDGGQRLVFHNAAYRHLWGLEQTWLEQRPTDSEVLDRLRMDRMLPEQFDFRAWKAELLSAYHSLETSEQAWYLPDGRTLRTVINPNPQGGVTYLFDDLTERVRLESQFNALLRVQSETLDTLKEGVAVFGSDGRLKLFNPSFARLWVLELDALGDRPHIDRIGRLCVPTFGNSDAWDELRAVVAGWRDQRMGWERRLARQDGSVLDCTASPLSDGATLLTFIDMTASVNVERALTERNQALIDAQELRNDFVHHVSYELRSPLTNIIGFIQFLSDPVIGELNDKQREYASYAMQSSSALLAIIDDILDLASIDADVMELSLEDVDIARTIEAAAEGVKDRLADSNLTLQISGTEGIGSFVADSKRVRQILFNLLSNAIGFSAPGQVVALSAQRDANHVIFQVSDKGRGIPDDVIEHVFERFKTHTTGSRHRGVGLGLSIVRAFVELHGGHIVIDTAPGEGTNVKCIFPALEPRPVKPDLAECTGAGKEQEHRP